MPEYRAPGVYIEEISFRQRNIDGVPTHSTALIGIAEHGPQNTPTPVYSLQEFLGHFATDSDTPQPLTDAVRGFFENGGRRLYVIAIANADGIPAALATLDTLPAGPTAGTTGDEDGDGGEDEGQGEDGDEGDGDREGEGEDEDGDAANVDYIALVAAPGFTDETTQQALITHCEQARYRFAILDAIAGSDIQQVRAQRQRYDTKRAALYYPWLEIKAGDGNTRTVPPSGHIAGLYARVDTERGVHKSPANEVLRGIVRLERNVNQAEQAVLNPEGINVIRDFRSDKRGIRVWGARTISSDPEWKYVGVRRLFDYIEHSIERGTGWAVFEQNGERLWATVRRTVENFLVGLWRDGALMGQTADHAFFVRCDRSTMTQTDIDNGRLICEIGIAPLKPAEFVIFRMGQWTADA
ncbi:hypothetical protein ABI59_15140 [Acidobacteria bacterium Mor1]|nr:hypothetical protein ABI59_15140 [Acidobacteria bacterium Mor1]